MKPTSTTGAVPEPQPGPLDAYKTNGLSPPAAALRLAESGWPVFPIAPGAKAPPLVSRGFYAATTHPLSVRYWWRRWPGANVGVRTGNGVLVVDVDPRSGGTVPEWLPETLTVATPSGGCHLYFYVDGPVPSGESKLGAGVDVKGDGGYVLAPPSRIDGKGAYRWTNLAPIASLSVADFQEHVSRKSRRRSATRRQAAVPPENWQPFEPRDEVGDGERHAYLRSYAGWLRCKGCLRDEIEELLFAENERACNPPMDDEEWIVRLANWAGGLPE